MIRGAVLASIVLLTAFLSPEAGEGRAMVNTPPPSPAAFRWRGVLEGFYGRPWTWAQRRKMVSWMPAHHLNLFVIAPKDDPRHRRDWRTPLSPTYLKELSSLVTYSRSRSVEIAWTLSPLGIRHGSSEDLAAAAAKLESVYSAGVRQLVLALDDVDSDPAQFRFADRVLARLADRCLDAEWTFVPAEYWGDAAPSAYLSALARDLDQRWRVGWTGPGILSARIDSDDARRFGGYVRHELVLGDNYPVQDRVIGAGRLYWGPVVRRDSDLAVYHEAYLANASPLPEASRVPLATAAEYAWAPDRYDPQAAWRRAVLGESRSEALQRFAAYNVSSWLSPEPGAAAQALEEAFAGEGKPAPSGVAELKRLARLRADLDRELGKNALREEIEPWAAKLELQARAILVALDDAEHHDVPRRRLFFRRLGESEEIPAVVAGQALDRILYAAAARAESKRAPSARSLRSHIRAFAEGKANGLAGALEDIARAPETLRVAGAEAALWRDAMPWLAMLADAAADARAALGSRPGIGFAPLRRWKARLRFLPLAAAKAQIEYVLGGLQPSWLGQPRPRKIAFPLRAYILFQRIARPEGLPGHLAVALDAYENGDARPLKRLFSKLGELPAAIRAAVGPELPVDGAPWLDKIGEYGRAGRQALDLIERGRRNDYSLADADKWSQTDERLRSANGLEIVFERKLELEALARWLRLPRDRRHGLPQVAYPADPREML